MTEKKVPVRRWWGAAVVGLALGVAACGGNSSGLIPADVTRPDQYLFERGTEALADERWLDAREYFTQIVDNYPQSPYRPQAKLGLGETYMGEGGTEALLRAANEFEEFLRFYPTNERADYAQFQLAMTHYRQMRSPANDQTETRAALEQFDIFFQRYPNSPLAPEVRERQREARNRLSEASYRVGAFYFRQRNYLGAADRFREVLREDPQFENRDRVYYHLAESLARMGRTAEAAPYYQRLLDEFDDSEYLDEARRRLDEIAVQNQVKF